MEILLTSNTTAVVGNISTDAVAKSSNSTSATTEVTTTTTDAGVNETLVKEAAGEVTSQVATDEVTTDANTEGTVTDETATDETVADDIVTDETATDEVVTDETITEGIDTEEVVGEVGSDVAVEGEDIMIDDPYVDPIMNGDMGEGMVVDPGMTGVKDPLLSSWPFVIGISVAVLFVSIALGAFLAKRKIKKGIELYED